MNPVEERYFNGTPCKRGHAGRRYKSTGACVDCQSLHSLQKRQKAKLAVAAAKEHEACSTEESAHQLATA